MEAFSSDSNTCHYQFDESFLIFPCFREVEQDYNHISLHKNPWLSVAKNTGAGSPKKFVCSLSTGLNTSGCIPKNVLRGILSYICLQYNY